MSRNPGRHRITRRTKIATGALGLALAVGGLVVITTAGDPGSARADAADPSFFVDITKVQPNVKQARQSGNASKGTFTVDCGRNENGHFNPDNFIAQPGVKNGAQHLHDYVGNLSTNADSNNKSLEKAGTTCKNGDKSAYFWPVIRIDKGDEGAKKNPPAKKQERQQQQANDRQAAQDGQIVCPDVASELPDVPAQAQAEVQRNLDLLDKQVDEANDRLVSTKGQGGPNFVQNAILGPLKDKRVATIDRIAIAIGRNAAKPQGLDRLAACSLGKGNDNGGNQDNGNQNNGGQNNNGGNQNGGNNGNQNNGGQNDGAQQVDCPDVAGQLPNIPAQAQAEVKRNLDLLKTQIDEANKRLVTSKGEGGPNFVQNAILGPLKDKRVATIDRIAIAIGRNAAKPQGLDRLAPCGLKGGADESDNNELEGNDGEIQRPEKAELTFRGSAAGKVTAMPKFLRILYGDAKVSTNGPKNARDSWTCSGFEDRVLINKYPICPEGSKVKRIHDFPSCWDGKNTDSANHRDHIVYPDQNGKCRNGFKAVPQLRVTLTYNIPHDVQVKGQYKVDSFPQEKHNPFSDHDDFANVMSQAIMSRVVDCINNGKSCKE